MIKIRPLGAQELRQVFHLLERYGENDFEYPILQKFRQLYVPIQRASQMLPAQFQFLPAIYVAVSHRKVLGLIWLSRDGKKRNRWKIDQLIIDPDEFSYDVGTQLVHYIINRYGGEGVQTFLAYVDSHCDQALGLLKSCGFRHCTRLHGYQLENPTIIDGRKESITGLREADGADRHKLQQLHSYSLVPEVRLSLEKTPADFSKPFLERLGEKMRGVFAKRWVVEDTARDLLLGSLEVYTVNYKDYHLSLMISPGWADGFEPLLRLGIQHVLNNTRTAKIHLQIYDFNKDEMAMVEQLGFSRSSMAEVLVKDYWIPLEDTLAKPSSPIVLFTGKASPACSK